MAIFEGVVLELFTKKKGRKFFILLSGETISIITRKKENFIIMRKLPFQLKTKILTAGPSLVGRPPDEVRAVRSNCPKARSGRPALLTILF